MIGVKINRLVQGDVRCAWSKALWWHCVWDVSQHFMLILVHQHTHSIRAAIWRPKRQSSAFIFFSFFWRNLYAYSKVNVNNFHFLNSIEYRYWASVDIPHGTMGFQAVCPFCATPLDGSPGYIKLIFQDNLD